MFLALPHNLIKTGCNLTSSINCQTQLTKTITNGNESVIVYCNICCDTFLVTIKMVLIIIPRDSSSWVKECDFNYNLQASPIETMWLLQR